ncbi:PREDICTED: CSC1-like protein At4g02900 isoform X1 [Nicotiana attenuata]|uniref:Csc1-like protein n=2 Tax=Nicotiana attenuata TaxID=49451 RepID=A0A1J6IJY0_NICAT|nr:PREDICTED: CSC1-like protein At4g02900 isoform X1 [Nicotiana attenuata]XP_019243319.1 PREDICTED: CSC1-like protein At4g02900 isoform X1 [Nicotiana attenuata]OIT04588.1 csc1-like protein [Nicotiana attenuata]
MASIQDISVSAVINLISAVVFLLAFAIVRLQPINDRVYFPKWYLKGIRPSPRSSGTFANKFVNLDFRTYIRFLNWMPAALKMPEQELIDHAGLDSAVYIRIYLLGLKIFVPITILSFAVLVPVNWTAGETLEHIEDLTFSNIDRLSISNVPSGSQRFWAHVMMAYVFTFWTFYILYKEYKTVSTMRLHFSENRRPDQFTVLVKNVPPDPDESVDEHVEHFFRVNHPDHYLSHQVVYNANKLAELVEKKKSFRNWLTYYQTKYERNPVKKPKIKTGFWGLWGKSVDAIDYYMTEIEKLSKEEAEEREKVISDPNAIVPAAFVSFKSRWGAAVCAQTQQSRNSTIWLTEWAPEPRDVYWDNLSIPYIQIAVRRLLMAVALFFLTFFFMIPIGFVQAFASIDGIKKVLPFLKSLIEMDVVKSFVQGFLPGIVLKIFLILLPMILMTMSKIEGFTSLSSLDRRSASKYHLFVIVNVFFGSIITGAAFQQLQRFLNQSPTEIPKTIGVTLPMKATFFITFIMVDGWAGIAAEILRLVPLVMFHIKNTFLVKTEHDREQAMDPGSLNFSVSEPRLQLYFLLGLVYSVVTPILLPFIIVFFAFAYMVFRHQIINVYDQKYESGASFWPDVNRRILIGLVISQLLLIGLLSTKDTAKSTPLLIVLIVLTIWFHKLCKGRFESVFVKCPLQDAVVKDTIERSTEPNFNLKEYLHNAYLHPVLKVVEFEVSKEFDEENNPLVATKRISQWSSKTVSNGTAEDGI